MNEEMSSIDSLFEKLDALDPGSLLVDLMDAFENALPVESDYQASALRVNVETAKWSAQQNPQIADRYCRELGWTPGDLAAMMIMQCAIVSMTSGEFVSSRGALTRQGDGFRWVWDHCIQALLASGRITSEIADIERRELDADILDTEPASS